jgi:hypothetical protein
MRKTLQRRPGFELLESLTLLSGLPGAAVSSAAPNPIHLTGSIEIVAILRPPYATAKGSGSISPLGHVTESANGLSLLTRTSESLTLTARTGKVFVSISGLTPDYSGTAGKYTITGGTKAYARETGSGNIQITVPLHGKFSAIYS